LIYAAFSFPVIISPSCGSKGLVRLTRTDQLRATWEQQFQLEVSFIVYYVKI